MFFYLLHNSHFLDYELDKKTKFIKLLIYGSLAHMVLHGCLFIGGRDALLYSLRSYFWIFFTIDCISISLINAGLFFSLFQNSEDKEHKLIREKELEQEIELKNNQKKKVRFAKNVEISEPEDSDMPTDIEDFKKSLEL